MVEFPLVEREIGRFSRRKTTFALRMVMGGVSFALVAFFFLQDLSLRGPNVEVEIIGEGLKWIAQMFQFGVAVFLPSLLTAGLVAQEKQERTLGLLMLADFRGHDIFLSKLLSSFLYCEVLILGTLPVLAFSAIFGGVQVGDVVLQVLLFSACTLMHCAIGLFCSTVSQRPGTALFGSSLIVLATVAGPPILILFGTVPPNALLFDHPAFVAWNITDGTYSFGAWAVPATIAASLIIAGGVSLGAIILLPRQAYDKPKRAPGPSAVRRAYRRIGRLGFDRLFQNRPLVQIMARGAGGLSTAIRPWPLRVLASLALMLAAPFFCIGNIFVAALVCYDVLSSLDAARRGGVWDDIRLTAPGPADFVWEIFLVQLRRSLFYLPAIFVTGGFGMAWFLIPTRMVVSTEALATSGVSDVVAALALLLILATFLVLLGLHLVLLVAIACNVAKDRASLAVQATKSVVIYVVIMILGYFLIGLGAPIVIAVASGMASPIFVDPYWNFLSAVGVFEGVLLAGCVFTYAFAVSFYGNFRRTWRTYV